MLILFLVQTANVGTANAGTCTGKFINPISDICWRCIFPISIGDLKLIKASGGMRDTPNPSNKICVCTKNIPGIGNVPIPGISLGFWEPIRLIDVTRTPFCMVNLGGLDLKLGQSSKRGTIQKSEGGLEQHAFYHTHYYLYPLIYWLELLTDIGCLEEGSFDLAYLSEFDPTYGDDELSMILDGEGVLFANPLAQLACMGDCVAANVDLARDELFWCAGCIGSLYPFNGFVEGAGGGVQASSLLAMRVIAKMHRLGLAQETSTDSSSMNGPLCRKCTRLTIKKSQYRLQMLFPRTVTGGELPCFPIGITDFIYHSFKEFPGGEDFGYLVWRKKNCCFL